MQQVELENSLEISKPFSCPAIPPQRHIPLDYQEIALKEFEQWWDNMDEQREALIALATGLGKTYLAALCAEKVLKADDNVLWVTNREELVNQTKDDLEEYIGISVDVEQAEKRRSGKSKLCVTTALTSKGTRLDNLVNSKFNPKLIIIDEAHHSAADTVQTLKRAFPDARILNLTATPYKRDISKQMALGKVLAQMCINEAIAGEYLVGIEKSKQTIEVEGLSVVKAISNSVTEASTMTDLMTSANVIEASTTAITEEFKSHPEIEHMKGIVYACNTVHGKAVTESLRAKNPHLRIDEIYHDTPKKERNAIIAKYKKGELDILVNNMCLTEGFNDPSTNFICMLRPTSDAGLWTQIVGRGLRKYLGKSKCILMDPIDRKKTVGMDRDEGLPDMSDLTRRKAELGRDVSMAELVLYWFRRNAEIKQVNKGLMPMSAMKTLNSLSAHNLYTMIVPATLINGRVSNPKFKSKLKKLDALLLGKTTRKDPTGLKTLAEIFDIPGEHAVDGFATFRKFLAGREWNYCPHLKLPELPETSQTSNPRSDINPEASAALSPMVDFENAMTELFTKDMLAANQIQNFCEQFPIAPKSKICATWFKPLGNVLKPNIPNEFHFISDGYPGNMMYLVRDKKGAIHKFEFKEKNGVCEFSATPNTTQALPWHALKGDWLVQPASMRQLNVLNTGGKVELGLLKLTKTQASQSKVCMAVASAAIKHKYSETGRKLKRPANQTGLSDMDIIKEWLIANRKL